MTKPSRFTFSLLRLMLSMAAMAVVLAIGHWLDSPLAPIVVATAMAGLLMFVIQWRHVPLLLFEGMLALLGAGLGCILFRPTYAHFPGEGASDRLDGAIFGALFGWLVACFLVRLDSPSKRDLRNRSSDLDTEWTEVRPLEDAAPKPDDTEPPGAVGTHD